MPPQPPIGYLNNRILCLYNQFPRDYVSIAEMTALLPNIAQMDFNAVWINPIQGISLLEHEVRWLDGMHHGSLYAMRDHSSGAFCINGNEADLREYTRVAREDYHLTPLFDLVLNHIAEDSPLCLEYPDWFRSSNFGPKFQYNSRHRADIVNFWKGYIDRYILDYGFMGVRVDATKWIPSDVQREIYEHIQMRCREKHNGINPVIFAELLLTPDEVKAGDLERKSVEYRKLGISHTCISHVTGNAYCDLSTIRIDRGSFENRYLHNMGTQSQIGAVVGYTGSHDQRTLFGRVIEEKAKQLNLFHPDNNFNQVTQNVLDHPSAQELESLMKKKIALVSFMSNGGWYILGGDEFGNPGMQDEFISDWRKCTKLVFASHDTTHSFVHNSHHNHDLRNFISNVNSALRLLPEPEIGDWMEYIEMKHQPNLLVIIRHSEMTHITDRSQLLFVNISNERMLLHAGSIAYIQQSRRYTNEEQQCPLLGIQQPILLGDIEIGDNVHLNNPIIRNEKPFHPAPTSTGTPPVPTQHP